MSDTENNQQQTVSADRTKGRCKWFNNKAGYGFLTVGEGDDVEDVFVHHSALRTGEEQYKYAVEGEYVEFVMSSADSDNHKWQASDVTGLDGGPLLCETRNARRQHDDGDGASSEDHPRHSSGGRSHRGPPRGGHGGGGRGGGGRPRFSGAPVWTDEEDSNFEWTVVRRRRAGGQGGHGGYGGGGHGGGGHGGGGGGHAGRHDNTDEQELQY